MAHEPSSVRRRAGRAIAPARSDEMALTRGSSSDPAKAGLALGLTPSGTLALRAAPDADPLDPAVASRIQAAFALGAGHGLLHLGAAVTPDRKTSAPRRTRSAGAYGIVTSRRRSA